MGRMPCNEERETGLRQLQTKKGRGLLAAAGGWEGAGRNPPLSLQRERGLLTA